MIGDRLTQDAATAVMGADEEKVHAGRVNDLRVGLNIICVDVRPKEIVYERVVLIDGPALNDVEYFRPHKER